MDSSPQPQKYVLGSHAQELARLDAQARAIESATRVLLGAAGLEPGSRVLDLGTGLGHVAGLVLALVGPSGSVVGLDRSAAALAEARRRAAAAGEARVTFVEGDVTTWRDAGPFDAVVGRLLLFHVADPVGVIRHHAENLRPGGRFVAIDFDVGASRCEPSVPLVERCLEWVTKAFRAAGASPMIGTRLGMLLHEAGLHDVRTFGIQAYLPPSDAAGPAMLAGVVRSLAGAMAAHGIATAGEIGLDTLEARIAAALTSANAVILVPAVAGAWGTRPAS
jgi:ubiquinone/menaquinone biosynthesis C-methylase UbiE